MSKPKVDHTNTICCICGSKDTYIYQDKLDWRRYYDSNGNWDKKSYTCYNCRLVGIDKHKNYLADKIKGRKCCICGGDRTYKDSSRRNQWSKYCDSKGDWDKKSYICYHCGLELERIKTRYIKDLRLMGRECCICHKKDTHIDNSGIPQWHKYRGNNDDEEWDRRSWSCNKCHHKILSRLPDSHNNIRKALAKRRITNVDLNRFDFLSDAEKGYFIENVVVETYKIKNYNDETNNFNSPFDAIHPEFGILQIKHSSLDIERGIWYLNIGDNHNFDFLIAVCMDENKPWKAIKRIYKIPYKDISDQKSITITEDPSKGFMYEKFRIDVGPFNDTYINMKGSDKES